MAENRRHAFRPALTDVLEERVVLSQATIAAAGVHAAAHVNRPQPFRAPVGALGDSYTDEYQFYTPDRYKARNWVEILHTTRQVPFGQFTTRARAEPRDEGFANNWARSGATSSDMVQNQLPGLVDQVRTGQVKYASVFIGGNDYLHLIDQFKAGQIAPENAPAAIMATTAQLETNFVTAVQSLLQASPGVKVVVTTLPAIINIPIARATATANPMAAALIAGIDQAVANYNGLIRNIAATNSRVALLDLDAFVGQAANNTTGTIDFGGQTIRLTTPGDDYHDFFLGDYYHAGTVAQGMIAQLFAQAIDQKFAANLNPPTPQEILRLAAKVQRQSAHVNPAHLRT